MIYENTVHARFIRRLNRFTAESELSSGKEIVHIRNTGRLVELLIPGAEIVLQDCASPGRKTRYDLITVRHERLGWVNADSLAPNRLVGPWLQSQGYKVRPEAVYGESRLDFDAVKAGEHLLCEVKGCTLEHEGVGLFPDAPSKRACRHLAELERLHREGYRTAVLFVIGMNGVRRVEAFRERDPAFADAMEKAQNRGVETWYLPTEVTENSISIASGYSVPVLRQKIHSTLAL